MPGSTPCQSCPPLLRPCLTQPKITYPTRFGNCRSTPRAWVMASISYLARSASVGRKTQNFAFALVKWVLYAALLPFSWLSFDFPPPQFGPAAQAISLLPYTGGNDIGQDRISKLTYFNFLLSCFRRDSHKIDSFLKVLRCRAARMQPELC